MLVWKNAINDIDVSLQSNNKSFQRLFNFYAKQEVICLFAICGFFRGLCQQDEDMGPLSEHSSQDVAGRLSAPVRMTNGEKQGILFPSWRYYKKHYMKFAF